VLSGEFKDGALQDDSFSGRTGLPEEVGHAVAFLAIGRARVTITGIVLNVNGGLLIGIYFL